MMLELKGLLYLHNEDEHLPNRHGQNNGNEQRAKGQIEERRANGDFLIRHSFQRQRVKRADENRGTARRQQKIVEHQRAFARHGRENTTGL